MFLRLLAWVACLSILVLSFLSSIAFAKIVPLSEQECVMFTSAVLFCRYDCQGMGPTGFFSCNSNFPGFTCSGDKAVKSGERWTWEVNCTSEIEVNNACDEKFSKCFEEVCACLVTCKPDGVCF